MKPVRQPDIFKTLLDAQPDAVVWFEPVFEEGTSAIVDFRAGYCNQAAAALLHSTPESIKGEFLSSTDKTDAASIDAIREQCLQAWQSGGPVEFTYYSPAIDRFLRVQRSRVNEGILSITRDVSGEVKTSLINESLEKKLSEVTNTSKDGIILLRAVKNRNNVIVDFELIYSNHAGRQIFNEKTSSGRLSALLPQRNLDQLFDKLVQSSKSNKDIRFDACLQNLQDPRKESYTIYISPITDGMVLRFTDITERRQQQQLIEAQKEELENILESSLNAVMAVEAIRNEEKEITDLLIIKVNSNFTKMNGISKAEAEGSSFLKLFPTTKKLGIFEKYAAVIESGKNFRTEMQYKGEGIDGWFDIAAVKNGAQGMVLTFTDITRQKRTVDEIKQQKLLLDNLLQYSPSAISIIQCIRDEHGKIIDFRNILLNDAAANATGFTREELLSRSNMELDPSFNQTPAFSLLVECLETGQPAFPEYYFEQTEKWIEGAVSKMNDDHLITMFSDVTEQKKAQLERERSSEKFMAVINTSQAGFFMGIPVRNETGRITDFRFTMLNHVLASFVGKEPAQLIGQLGSSFFPKYQQNGLLDVFRACYEAGDKKQFDFNYKGEYVDVWANVMITRIGDELMGSFTDFTENKKLQIKLEESVQELEKMNRNLEDFAYAASHDLKEPARKISFFISQLRQKAGESLSDEAFNLVGRIEKSASRMDQLINDLLQFSIISRSIEETEDVDLNEVLQHVLEDLELKIRQQQATVQKDKLPGVKGNRRQLQQLFQNLIDNAIKYHQPGRPPEVNISYAMRNDLQAKPGREYHVISVRDNGIGFPAESGELIFKMFTRLHGRSAYEGTGIGLAIARKSIENHGGIIWAESEEGKGSCFHVAVPVQ